MKKLLISFLSIFLFKVNSFSQSFNLQEMIDTANDNDTIFLQPGIYYATPSPYIEEECGNCSEHNTTVYGTKGFIIENKSLHIVGSSKEEVILKTNAGYGFLFLNSKNSFISNLTIGGGVRDTSGDATNGAIVVKYSTVEISNCIISNDTIRKEGDPVVGICGIVVRENSKATISNNQIINNTWDGIALYRGAMAFIVNNEIKNGRGAGIGITWDAGVFIIGNRVLNFWKGIGTFGNSSATLVNNAVFDNLGWGVVISGNSEMSLYHNVITRNGNCGVATWTSGEESVVALITNNIITSNGWRKEWVCPQVGYWMNAPGSEIIFEYNNVWGNEQGDYRDTSDLTGIDGNISVDPEFICEENFYLKETSPLLNAGHPDSKNKDGSRSHIGLTELENFLD